MAKKQGVAGIVIFGTVRDYEDIVKSKVPVYALGTSPGGPLKSWAGNINYPIACAGVVINAGDVVRGDDDGIVVIPADISEKLLLYCARRLLVEAEWLNRVKVGEATLDIVNLRSKLDQFGIIFE